MSLFRKPLELDNPENRNPETIELLIKIFKPLFWRYFQPVVRGLEHIPSGPGLYVGNHNGAMLMPDLFIFGMALHERFGLEGLPYGMAHKKGIGLPLLNLLFLPIGALRGSQDNAKGRFASGAKVLTYPGGELDSMRSYWNRKRIIFGNRRGYIRLALREEVPIIPVVSAGAHETLVIFHDGQWLAQNLGLGRFLHCKTWPIVFCIPWGLWVGPPPPHFPFPSQIFIEVLPPVRFDHYGPAAALDKSYVESCHQQVHSAMEATLKRLDRMRRQRRQR